MGSLGRTGGAVIKHSNVFFVGFGFAIWAIATIIFRLFGEVYFISENSIVMLLIFVVTGISSLPANDFYPEYTKSSIQ